MKKILPLLLALLMLWGCGTEVPAPTDPATAETQAAAESPAPELVLDTWDLPYDVLDAVPMGDDILLFTGESSTTLVKLNGKNREELATAALGCYIYPQSPAVQITQEGVCYYDAGAVVFLDADLKEFSRILLPETAMGEPAVSADLNTLYYASADALRAIDRDTGIDRLLREVSFQHLTINGLHLGDTVMECLVFDRDYNASTLFFSTATGELVSEYLGGVALWSGEALWYAAVSEGGYEQKLFGTVDGEIQALNLDADSLYFLPELGSVLTESADTLSLYSLDSGTKTAALTLEEEASPTGLWADAEKNQVWFLLDGNRLCRWSLEKSAVSDAVSCIGPYYTRENPDTEGLAALEAMAAELETVYGVRIHIGEKAAAAQPFDYVLTSEYRAEPLRRGLEALSAALSRFTPEFLRNAGKASHDGMVHIGLIQSLSGTLDTAQGLQYWDDNGNARIVLSIQSDVEQNFYHELAHIIDARVMSECNAFDNWEWLNPKGFDYDYDYIANLDRDGSAYADAFIDTYAMSFPTEDRARIFEYALTADSADRFASDTMQKKLAALCSGIRKAFGLTDSEEILPWEQYLTR